MGAKIDTVDARTRAKPRSEPYWVRLAGGCMLGYRKLTAGSVGAWYARYRDPETGHRAKTSLGDFSKLPPAQRYDAAKKDAEQWFTHLGRGGAVVSVTVRIACENYVKHVRTTKGDDTADDLQARFARWVDDTPIGRVAIAKLTRRQVDAWRAGLAATPVVVDPRAKTPRTRPRAASSVNRDCAALRAALNYAHDVVFETPVFAMKGGTALNLFVQDMPRLSVDIDVVFVPYDLPREDALQAISAELAAAQDRVRALGYDVELRKNRDGTEAKLFVRSADAEVKVEVNFVFRGTVMDPTHRSLTPAAQQMFAADIQVPVLADAELYGSKLVAALDRQHPRDLFDVQLMLDSHGWDERLLDCFVVYLAGHNRPTHEVLFPNEKPLADVFKAEFEGMTMEDVALDDLLSTRWRMLEELPRQLLPRHCDFLRSIVRAEPDWSLLPYAHLRQLPALQWKLSNLSRLKRNAPKFQFQYDELTSRLATARG